MKVILLRLTLLLIVLAPCSTCLYAQDPIKKPEKKQKITTTAKPKTGKSNKTNINTDVSEPTGYINGYGFVDLGLRVKWATCNIGASSPSDYGNYYAWGRTKTSKENTESDSDVVSVKLGNIAGNPKYDAARANWGSTWRLPTAKEMEELSNMCTLKWTQQGNHAGYKVIGPNGNSIFLPAGGSYSDKGTDGVGEWGQYWSSTPYENTFGEGAFCFFFMNDVFPIGWMLLSAEYLVRPVSE